MLLLPPTWKTFPLGSNAIWAEARSRHAELESATGTVPVFTHCPVDGNVALRQAGRAARVEEDVVRQDAVVWQLDPGLLVARVVVVLGARLRPGVRRDVVEESLRSGNVAGEDLAVVEQNGRIVAEARFRERRDRRPGSWLAEL